MEGEGDQLRSCFPLVVRLAAPVQVCNSLRKADGSARLGGMSLGLSAFASLRTRKSPKSPSQQKSAHLRPAVDTALSAETSKTSRNDSTPGAEPAKSARNPLRNSLRKSLLPIVQLAAPHSQLRCSSPVTKRAAPRLLLRPVEDAGATPAALLAGETDASGFEGHRPNA